MQAVRAYYWLTKPGIVYGNSIALAAGYAFAVLELQQFTSISLVLAVIGTALVMASACVTNNIFDRDIDAHMTRTKKRAMVMQTISVPAAWMYATILLFLGLFALSVIDALAVILGTIGWVTYALIYTYLKRVTYHATLFGTIPGAIPPLIGYVAGSGDSWLWASGIFVLMIGWQMVHFYAIAIYRYDDYANASVPVVTRVLGVERTLRAIEWWVIVTVIGIVIVGIIDVFYAVLCLMLLGWWLFVTEHDQQEPSVWSRKVFFSSLLFLVVWLCLTTIAAVRVVLT